MKNFLRALLVITLLLFPLFAQSQQVPQQIFFEGLTGNQLLDSLAVNYKPTTVLGYNGARDVMFTQIYNENNFVVCAYTGDVIFISANSTTPRSDAFNENWNTEHVWPQSKGAGTGNSRSDLHHLRPVRGDVNSSRGNSPFAYLQPQQVNRWWQGSSSQSNTPNGDLGLWSKTGSGLFEVLDAEKGNAARSKFYFFTMYRQQALNADPVFFYQQMETLRSYHNQDAVDIKEYDRTYQIAAFQGGAINPFIVDTTLVRRAFFEDFDFDLPSNPDNPGDGEGYFVNFENESKGPYASGDLLLNGKSWNLTNILIGTDNNDQKFDSKSARFRHNTSTPAVMSLLEDLEEGIGTISFWMSRSNFSGDKSDVAPELLVEYSTNGGATWISASPSIDLDDLSVLTEFTFNIDIDKPARVKFRSVSGSNGRRFNIDNISITPFKEEHTIVQNYSSGWNLVGLPTEIDHASFTQIFPAALPETLFGFNDGYTNESILYQGKGYWLKFQEESETEFKGDAFDMIEIPVNMGWNLITVNHQQIFTSSLLDDDNVLTNGIFWGYQNGYYMAEELEPGKGYWVETTGSGFLEQSQNSNLLHTNSKNTFIIDEAYSVLDFYNSNGFKQQLFLDVENPKVTQSFSLPPLPPSGTPDVRFADNSLVSHSISNIIYVQQSTNGNISVNFKNGKVSESIALTMFNGPIKVGEVLLSDNANFNIPDNVTTIEYMLLNSDMIDDLPNDFSLSQNYPNPFNPTTTIQFSLPHTDVISLTVYNLQGQIVATLFQGMKEEGLHSAVFNASNLASGVYYYRLQNSRETLTRKMMLIK